jgi:hypothetical protein
LTTKEHSPNLKIFSKGQVAEISMQPTTPVKVADLPFRPVEGSLNMSMAEFKKLKTASLKEVKWSLQDRLRRHRL